MRQVADKPLTADEVEDQDAYWRATSYLSVGQIYLLRNALLTEPLQPADVKPRLLRHWAPPRASTSSMHTSTG
jgi:xylulose-5-phosphate/fructose-6-phosphate phosphoketolase